jgi:hypothetical protein
LIPFNFESIQVHFSTDILNRGGYHCNRICNKIG